jgi:uncharacterized protein (DUF1778 family)
MMHSGNEPRSERIDIRTTPTVKRLLQQAATACHKHVSEFLLEQGIAAAAGTLADRRLFLLDDDRWREFLAALDRPAEDRPHLRRLLTSPGPLD